jgi:hypothetical protein
VAGAARHVLDPAVEAVGLDIRDGEVRHLDAGRAVDETTPEEAPPQPTAPAIDVEVGREEGDLEAEAATVLAGQVTRPVPPLVELFGSEGIVGRQADLPRRRRLGTARGRHRGNRAPHRATHVELEVVAEPEVERGRELGAGEAEVPDDRVALVGMDAHAPVTPEPAPGVEGGEGAIGLCDRLGAGLVRLLDVAELLQAHQRNQTLQHLSEEVLQQVPVRQRQVLACIEEVARDAGKQAPGRLLQAREAVLELPERTAVAPHHLEERLHVALRIRRVLGQRPGRDCKACGVAGLVRVGELTGLLGNAVDLTPLGERRRTVHPHVGDEPEQSLGVEATVTADAAPHHRDPEAQVLLRHPALLGTLGIARADVVDLDAVEAHHAHGGPVLHPRAAQRCVEIAVAQGAQRLVIGLQQEGEHVGAVLRGRRGYHDASASGDVVGQLDSAHVSSSFGSLGGDTQASCSRTPRASCRSGVSKPSLNQS